MIAEPETKEIIHRIVKVSHGFKLIEAEALKLYTSLSIVECLTLTENYLQHEAYQVRSLSVFLLGYIAAGEPQALDILKNRVAHDGSWQVQEILAKAFDHYAHERGYENALPVINEWLSNDCPQVCRAVTEGLRIWTGRPYFNRHPEVAIELLSRFKGHESQYLRKSSGNALRDISKKYPEQVQHELRTWDLQNKRIRYTWALASKFMKCNP